MQSLIVNLIQTQLVWENSKANITRLNWHLQQSKPGAVVVLPEMFASGFSMNSSEIAQTMDGEAVSWMKEMSAERLICGSLAIAENGNYYNRFLAIYQGGIVSQYDKHHLFAYAGEDQHYSNGESLGIFEFEGWKIAPFVCFDLRFPTWIRQAKGADLMLFVANWPASRMKAWNSLLMARAIENQCYVVGVNRVGDDGLGISYSGCSQVIDFSGEFLISPIEKREQFAEVYLEKSPMIQFRERFPFLDIG